MVVNLYKKKTIFHLCIQESGLFQQFETRRRSGVLLGDSGYACKRWLLTPFRDNQLRGCRKRENYNREQKRARCLVERSFGQLKRRWACLHGELRVTPGKACKVIVACFALHNVAKEFNMPDLADDNIQRRNVVQPPRLVFNGREETGIRQHIVDTYFDY